jgi:hypothetical protein
MPRSVQERSNLDRVRVAMKHFGYDREWSHEEFAEKLNISRRQLEYIYSGERDFSAEVMISFCVLIGPEARERLFKDMQLPQAVPAPVASLAALALAVIPL